MDTTRTISQQIERIVADAVRAASGVEADPLVQPSANPQFGDYQSNVAMGLAGKLSKERGEKVNPRQLAADVVAKIDAGDVLANPPTVAGPGFINLTLSPAYLASRATAALADERLGVPAAEKPQTVVVEYSSPNIAKQMHVGHLRTTILGDAAARVLDFLGHKVIRQNHVGDWGTQFGMLIQRLNEIAQPDGEPASAGGVRPPNPPAEAGSPGTEEATQLRDLEAFYREAKKRFDDDADFQNAARRRVVELQGGDPAALAAWNRLVDATREHYESIYKMLGVLLTRDDERGESSYNARLSSLANELLAAGVAEESEGAIVSFAAGHTAPLMIRKSDGGFGYGTTDLAAVEHRAKELGADRVIYFVDARQSEHFQNVFCTAAAAGVAAGWPSPSLEHASFGSILGFDGKPISTRNLDKSLPPDAATNALQLENLLSESVARALPVVEAHSADLPEAEKKQIARQVGIGAVKYADLSKDRTSDYVFSFDAMLAFHGNTAVYLMYAHARTRSILRKAEEEATTVSVLEQPHELALAKHLLAFPDAVLAVGRELRPHLLCTYLYELATRFSGFYENCPVLKSEGDVRASRLALTALTAKTLAKGLELLGIGHPDRM